MFPQIVTTKKADGKTYRYLNVVENYREGKVIKKRIIATLGNIDRFSEKEIQQIILKLQSVLQNRVLGTVDDFNPLSAMHFGVSHVVQFLWDQLGLTQAIRDALKDRDIEFDVAAYIRAMVVNRLQDPSSKLQLFQTIEDLYLPDGGQDWQLQNFYRALDHLMDIKPELERFLYARLTDLLNFRLSLVFYDLTSTHVSGHCCPIAEHGYSRTHRPDLEQVELGLLVTPDGLPITHEVFEGNVPDKTTVPGILKRLKESFAVEHCVFVGDRGMVATDNMTALAEAGFPYIVGYHKRGRIVSDMLLERYADLSGFERIKDNLFHLEVAADAPVADDDPCDGARYILCHNPLKAVQDLAFRTSAMEQAETELAKLATNLVVKRRGRKADPKRVMVRVGDILTHKGMQAFFDLVYDSRTLTWSRNEVALAKEALRDGRFIVKTNTALPAKEVVLAYKSLMNVERAFREIKNFLEVGPLHHWNAKRVRGHIFVCVLAYLFEQEMQVLYRRVWQREADALDDVADSEERKRMSIELDARWYTGEAIVKELARWHCMKVEFLGKTFLSVPPPPGKSASMLASMGIPIPERLIPLHD
jgi:hypothetical protein